MNLHNKIEHISSKDDLADFIAELRFDLENNLDDWENPTLDRFLTAMEDYYKNTGQQIPQMPAWKTLADILYASKIYE